MLRLTRGQILAGMVGFVILMAPVLAAEDKSKAEKVIDNSAAIANNDFGLDLYRQLAKKNSGKPLFFSPYSLTNALVICAEGARGETGDEMGKVLRFPKALRRTGAEAAARPWAVEKIHPDLAAMNKRFDEASRPPSRHMQAKLAALRNALDEANKEVRRTNDRKTAEKARKLADQINEILPRINRYEVRVANAMWGEKTYPFKQAFLDTIAKYYQTGGAFPVDFKTNHEEARNKINAWVEERTRERIKDLVPPGAIDKTTRLVVANAIYFKGQWTEPFDAGQTRDQPFTLADGKKVQAPTMHADWMRSVRYAGFNKDGSFFDTPLMMAEGTTDFKRFYPDQAGFEMLELPYKGGDLSMVVLVPRSLDGLAGLEKQLTAANLKTWLGKLRGRPVHVFLPKFKLEKSFELSDVLEALGMKRAFAVPSAKAGAQFDGMTDTDDPREKLYLSAVLHKAFVEVNEKGTEAAAATAVLLKTASAEKDEPKQVPFTPTFKAERPFVFLIQDQKTGSILFLGRVINPTS